VLASDGPGVAEGTAMRRTVLLVVVLAACSTPVSHGNGPDASDDTGQDAPTPVTDAGVDGVDVDAAPIPPDAPPPPPIQVLRGIDRATAFSVSEAQSLKTNHGVKWTGVYIGGPCNGGSGWDKTLVTQLHDQVGWTFMPIYVGQQSPAICGATALNAGQGTADGQAAAAKMAQFGWGANKKIPVCLDLEAGSYSYSPSGATAYARAWRDAVRNAGYLAYVYSNPTAINGMYDANVKFDGAWPASWFYTSFQNVKPEDLTQLGTRYTHTNRAWQYGNFNVSPVGNIDGDTSDLLLAPAPGGSNL
jgi:hypothetical protein